MNKVLETFISNIENETKRNDSARILKIMEEESEYKPVLNGKIIGFGQYRFKYADGREGVGIVTGFSPRQQYIVVYIMSGFSKYGKELEILGKHKTAKVCIYFNKLADIDEKILRKMIKSSVKEMKATYECENA
ncbi:MAG: DUF1801 domain-containing protein [Pseudomonadota bacterium]